MQKSIIFDDFILLVKKLFSNKSKIPLHEPLFTGLEKKYVDECIKSTFVSSIGNYVSEFESSIKKYTGSKYAIATVNGTSALHIALKVSGVSAGTEVLTQSLSFVATCNAISYCGAKPVFIDINKLNLSMCPQALENFFLKNTEIDKYGRCINKVTKNIISACLPMHTYGLVANIEEINQLCQLNHVTLIEDAAESLGSFNNGKHTGNIGKMSAISFNGNKILTTGGGGMILTNDSHLAEQARHLTTTAKLKNDFYIEHSEIGYNYRMPNINAALGLGQVKNLGQFVEAKRLLAKKYQSWGNENNIEFLTEVEGTKSNYWLNTIILEDSKERDYFLDLLNRNNISVRPTWTPMHMQEIYKRCYYDNLENTEWSFQRAVNVPSSVVNE